MDPFAGSREPTRDYIKVGPKVRPTSLSEPKAAPVSFPNAGPSPNPSPRIAAAAARRRPLAAVPPSDVRVFVVLLVADPCSGSTSSFDAALSCIFSVFHVPLLGFGPV
ncbi:hypothetical protein Cni_G06100 [Canna indica]|uniref:Uncharacterized protein n=1 Tax=Canna indica TaxID=4628 RepID=A0AAQ3JWD7_9LILI|nr:hypothetical protein Cni_G06100 [Canna indica]